MIGIRPSRGRIEDIPFIQCVVEICIIVRERRELRALRRDLARWVGFVPLRFENVDLGRAAALCNRGAGMVRARARTGAIDSIQR